MVKKFKNIIGNYGKLIHNLTNAIQKEEIIHYEVLLFAYFFGSMLVVVSVITIPLGFFWGISLIKVLGYSCTILLGVMAMIKVSKRKTLSNNQKLHIIGIDISIILYLTFWIYYSKLLILIWFIIIIIIFFANLSSKNILFVYLTLFSMSIFLITLFVRNDDIIIMDSSYQVTLFLMLLFIITSSFISNQLYRKIMNEKMSEYRLIAEKNDEITSLYEELIASEEELKEQNEKLNQYNDEINENKKRLEFLAYNDALTGLPNRKMILEQLDYMISSDESQSRPFSIAFIDLDNFKKVNDSMGHSAGDALLLQVSNRLRLILQKSDMLGRLGGDELVLVVRKNIAGEELLEYVQRLCDVFEQSYMIDGVYTKVTASFGIAMYPEDAKTVEDLLKAADTAMYKAKDAGKNNIQFYDIGMKNEILSKMRMENQMIQALRLNEFYLEYQPLFSGKSKEVKGFEALIRWRSLNDVIISPGVFIPFAEEIGLIGEIGEWVLKEVCKKIRLLESLDYHDIKIAVNVSAIQMGQEHFIDHVKRIIMNSGIDPNHLEVEITESIFIQEKKKAVEKIMALKEMGISISMDDFGTGYSSLSYLVELPIDKLKIDRSFINRISEENSKSDIIGAIINMVHKLDMKVVAEGIETEEQLEYLEKESCDLLQGFLLSRPLSEEKMMKLLSDRN